MRLLVAFVFLFFFACSSSVQEPTASSKGTVPVLSVARPDSVPADTAVRDIPKLELLGQIEPSTHPDFVLAKAPYSREKTHWMRREAYQAFVRMADSARKEGVLLEIISATRTFGRQKQIWEQKWTTRAKEFPNPVARAKNILLYSSMPGSSRHHWGTDIDLNALQNADFSEGGKHHRAFVWLEKYAAGFGYCRPYTAKGESRPHGYEEERWHWSYLPISSVFLTNFNQKISHSDITGFQGAETVQEVQAIEHYVRGVACK